jgi:hypothetical protein
MGRPQAADGRHGLQIWRVAPNILNKQSRTADLGWLAMKCHKGTWTDYLDKRPKLRKMGLRFGTWNVRSLYRAGLLMADAKDIKI